MQPYFLPYLGYFQLAAAVDKFVIYDDVSFIKKGWVNRNRILVNGAPEYINLPLEKISQNRSIQDHLIASGPWKRKLLNKFQAAYGKAPYFDQVFPFIKGLVDQAQEGQSCSPFLYRSFSRICELLGVTVEIVPSSESYENSDLSGQDRIIDICQQEAADEYVNMAGGRELYDTSLFQQNNLRLRFLQPGIKPYDQGVAPFVGSLSIVDVLMFNSNDDVKQMVLNYTLQD